MKKVENNVHISNEIEMKFFQTIQKDMAAMGFVPNRLQNKNRKFSDKRLWGISFAVFGSSLIGIYIFHQASSREEYMYSVFTLITTVGIILGNISLIFKNDKFFEAIETGEMLLVESEFQILF